jgi:hypothetical protein
MRKNSEPLRGCSQTLLIDCFGTSGRLRSTAISLCSLFFVGELCVCVWPLRGAILKRQQTGANFRENCVTHPASSRLALFPSPSLTLALLFEIGVYLLANYIFNRNGKKGEKNKKTNKL